jgi:hypothetical protein
MNDEEKIQLAIDRIDSACSLLTDLVGNSMRYTAGKETAVVLKPRTVHWITVWLKDTTRLLALTGVDLAQTSINA